MSIEELEYKESRLRKEFMDKLECLDVDGGNDYMTVKCVKTYGVLWHLAHQLLMAEHNDKHEYDTGSATTAETMNIQATGLQMRNSK